MWFNYTITDLETFESDGVALELEENEARTYGVRLANDVLGSHAGIGQHGHMRRGV